MRTQLSIAIMENCVGSLSEQNDAVYILSAIIGQL